MQEEQPAADNTLHKQLLTASPNWFRTLFLRRRRRTNRTERRQETMPGIQSMRQGAVPKEWLACPPQQQNGEQ